MGKPLSLRTTQISARYCCFFTGWKMETSFSTFTWLCSPLCLITSSSAPRAYPWMSLSELQSRRCVAGGMEFSSTFQRSEPRGGGTSRGAELESDTEAEGSKKQANSLSTSCAAGCDLFCAALDELQT